jgi:hypothetical protein
MTIATKASAFCSEGVGMEQKIVADARPASPISCGQCGGSAIGTFLVAIQKRDHGF